MGGKPWINLPILPKGNIISSFMDLRMPVMDGLAAARAIRGLPRGDANVPIVAMTADAFAEDVERTQAAGMNDHLAKPLGWAGSKLSFINIIPI